MRDGLVAQEAPEIVRGGDDVERHPSLVVIARDTVGDVVERRAVRRSEEHLLGDQRARAGLLGECNLGWAVRRQEHEVLVVGPHRGVLAVHVRRAVARERHRRCREPGEHEQYRQDF